MAIERIPLVDQLRSIGMTALGIILCLIPPALWVAWTEAMLLMVAAVGAVSGALLVLLADFGNSGVGDGQPLNGAATREVLTDESIAEIHRIFPLTYHHSLVEKVRFRRAMEKVLHLIKGSDE